jgi:nicotinamide riboside kinase
MKFAFTGPESTGKTAVSQAVAARLPRFIIRPELARLYLEETKTSRLSVQEFIEICQKSAYLFRDTSEKEQILDTDMYVLRIWNSKEFKLELPEIEELCANPFDHHFICKPDFPWEPDPLRYGGTQKERDELFEEYVQTLAHFKAPYTILTGSLEDKINTAVKKIQELENDQPEG